MAALKSIKVGDIVKVERGGIFHALVTDKGAGELKIRPLESWPSYRTATSRQVIAHWRQTKNGRALST